MPTTHARQIAWLTHHPEACVQALQAARGVPPADIATLERVDPPSIRVILDGRLETIRSDLAWFARFGSDHRRGLLLVDAIHRFERTSVGSWPRLRAGVRLQVRCPTWMLVHTSRAAVITAIEAGFAHQRELMPILMGPEHPRPDVGQATRRQPDIELDRHANFPSPRLLTF